MRRIGHVAVNQRLAEVVGQWITQDRRQALVSFHLQVSEQVGVAIVQWPVQGRRFKA